MVFQALELGTTIAAPAPNRVCVLVLPCQVGPWLWLGTSVTRCEDMTEEALMGGDTLEP